MYEKKKKNPPLLNILLSTDKHEDCVFLEGFFLSEIINLFKSKIRSCRDHYTPSFSSPTKIRTDSWICAIFFFRLIQLSVLIFVGEEKEGV